jgi:hypothetical protein
VSRQPTQESFLKDVQNHVMSIVHESGIHRHVLFSRPGSSCYHFRLLTWPGELCITGDMGTFVFNRLQDMFEFFRVQPKHGAVERLHINLGYWSEKLVSTSKNGGHLEYDADMFRRAVVSDYRNYRQGGGEPIEGLREAIRDEVLACADDGEYAAATAAYNFQHGRFSFRDFFEHNPKEYTYHFIWCCYAIAWGIQQYDASKMEQAA